MEPSPVVVDVRSKVPIFVIPPLSAFASADTRFLFAAVEHRLSGKRRSSERVRRRGIRFYLYLTSVITAVHSKLQYT